MRNLIFGISYILLFGSFTSSEILLTEKETENCGCELTTNIESYLAEFHPTKEINNQQKELTEKEVKHIASRLCSDLFQSDTAGFEEIRIQRIIAEGLGLKVTDNNINGIVSAFLNKFKQELICPPDQHLEDYRFKLYFKSALLKGIYDLYDEILLNDEEYQIDFNAYEIVDNKKETLLDYIDKLIASNKYDKENLQMIQMDIEDLGGKRGAQLD